ncbi:MAG: SusE domain-containing protein [Ginsengibacter sp.]
MKNIIKMFLASFLLFGLGACKKVQNKVIFMGGENPVLTSTTGTGVITLAMPAKGDPVFKLSWTNPNYKFNTGVSSHDVNYTLQFDKSGANFSSSDLQEKSLSKELTYSPTVGELNTMMAKLGLKENESHKIEVRVRANFAGGAVPLFSNIVTFSAVPYLDVAVPLPVTGELFIVGSATPGEWNNPVPVPSQQLTKVNATTYEIILPLKGGQFYLLLPKNGSWDNKYAVKYDGTPPAGLSEGGDFGFNWDKDIPGPATTGTYKIELFFKTGKFKVTKM